MQASPGAIWAGSPTQGARTSTVMRACRGNGRAAREKTGNPAGAGFKAPQVRRPHVFAHTSTCHGHCVGGNMLSLPRPRPIVREVIRRDGAGHRRGRRSPAQSQHRVYPDGTRDRTPRSSPRTGPEGRVGKRGCIVVRLGEGWHRSSMRRQKKEVHPANQGVPLVNLWGIVPAWALLGAGRFVDKGSAIHR